MMTENTSMGVDVNASEPLSALDARTMHLFLTRGLIAIAWAIAFMAISDSRTTVTVGAGSFVVLYPLIDVVGCLIDAPGQHGSARRLLLANAAVSAVAAVALGVAATGSVANVLAVMLAAYALGGGIEFVIQAGLLARGRHRFATAPAPSASAA
jgi:hypothetical protein